MCIILDTNCLSKFKNSADQDMQLVREWLLRKNSKIVYSNTDKFKKEWKKPGMEEQLRTWTQARKLKLVDRQKMQEKENELKGKIASDDEHIVALAIIAKVKVLVSGGDKKLHEDFKNPELVGGKVYQQKSHSHLLTENTCP